MNLLKIKKNFSLQKFFQPAVNNIRANQGKASVNEDHIKEVCRQILEDAKLMYKVSSISRDSSPYDFSDTEDGRFGKMVISFLKFNQMFLHNCFR